MLKLGDFSGAKAACTSVLMQAPECVKALFRRASAYMELHEFSEAVADLKVLLQVEPNNRDALRMLPQAREMAKQENKRSKFTFSNMNKAFNGLADEEERRTREKKEAHEAEIARKGAEAKAEAKKWREGPGKNQTPEMAKEDLRRASEQMAEMQRKIREMEMRKWMGEPNEDE